MVTSSFLPGRGGIESYLAQLCTDLSPRLAVLAPATRAGKPIPGGLPYPAHGHAGSMLWPGRSVLRSIERAASTYGTTKVLFGTPWPLALLGPTLKARGMAYATIVHGAELILPAAFPGVKTRLARALAEADLLLPVSDYTSDRLRKLVQGCGHALPPLETLRARVDLERWHPEVDTAPVRKRLGLTDDDEVILCFGRLVRRKGVHRAIRALPAVSAAVPEAVLVVAGIGPQERRLKALAGRTQGRVVFAGRVPEEDAPALYALAAVFVLPVADRFGGLEVEGLGVVLLEAAACGTPCVTGRSGGTPEAVVDGRTGYVVDATNQDELVDAVVDLLRHPDRARAMGREGRAHVAQEFSSKAPGALLAWLADDIR
jgi:phosphatidylinositol alpha-1,6-mannosyltransferase